MSHEEEFSFLLLLNPGEPNEESFKYPSLYVLRVAVKFMFYSKDTTPKMKAYGTKGSMQWDCTSEIFPNTKVERKYLPQ